MITAINRHNLATYLTFYYEHWPQIEQSIHEKMQKIVLGEQVDSAEDQENDKSM